MTETLAVVPPEDAPALDLDASASVAEPSAVPDKALDTSLFTATVRPRRPRPIVERRPPRSNARLPVTGHADQAPPPRRGW